MQQFTDYLKKTNNNRSTKNETVLYGAGLVGSIALEVFAEKEIKIEYICDSDKKIQDNQKMSQTLEEIAKTLFKSWFIDFDPVRAKAEGRSTGLSKEISDLFPDSFEDSELGEIPKGFEIDSVKNRYEISIGKTPPRNEHQWFSKNSLSEGTFW